jgi:hypothetical protein
MNLVFIIEPFCDNSHSYPQFFHPYYKQILLPWCRNLKQYCQLNNKPCNIIFIISEVLDLACEKDKNFSYHSLETKKLTDIFGSYENYISEKKLKTSESLEKYKKIIYQKLKNFKSDIIIGCSMNASFLESKFPGTPILYNETALFGGVPDLSHTLYFDILQNNKSFLLRHKRQLNDISLDKNEEGKVDDIIGYFQKSITSKSSYLKLKSRLKKLTYKKYTLFALQRWSAELLQMNTDYSTELEYIESILSNTSHDIGVIVTMHKSSSVVKDKVIQEWLISKYPNAIFIDDLESPSNSAILLCDSVITTSSTVGLYAIFFEKNLLIPSKTSWLNFISDSNDVKEFKNILSSNSRPKSKKNILHYLLFNYCIPSSYIMDGEWFYRFLSNISKSNHLQTNPLELYAYTDETQKILDLHKNIYTHSMKRNKKNSKKFFGIF